MPLDVVGSVQTTISTLVKIEIGGKSYSFILDTGADRTVLDPAVASALDLPKVGRPFTTTTLGAPRPLRT